MAGPALPVLMAPGPSSELIWPTGRGTCRIPERCAESRAPAQPTSPDFAKKLNMLASAQLPPPDSPNAALVDIKTRGKSIDV
jgi:hypothetical protein